MTFTEYFIYKWSTRLKSMYNHMIGRTASVISPFYSLIPGIDFLKYTAYHRLILHTLLVLDHSLVCKKKYVLNFVEKIQVFSPIK